MKNKHFALILYPFNLYLRQVPHNPPLAHLSYLGISPRNDLSFPAWTGVNSPKCQCFIVETNALLLKFNRVSPFYLYKGQKHIEG